MRGCSCVIFPKEGIDYERKFTPMLSRSVSVGTIRVVNHQWMIIHKLAILE
jgi:hypothetical protein